MIVFVAAPYGQAGGGMGSVSAYLASLGKIGQFEMRPLESRGGGHVAFSPFFLAIAIAKLAKEVARGRLGILHINVAERASTYRKGILLAAGKLLAIPVLLHLHAAQIVQFYQQLPRSQQFLLRKMFQSADRCVVLGENSRRWITETIGVNPEAVTLIRNGVPGSPMQRTPHSGSFRLLFLGNLLERKGMSDLLHVLARPAILKTDITTTFAGGGEIERYKQLAERLGIAERVTFTGWLDQNNARQAIADADALVLPSYDEVLPLVILEALATRVPVICTPVGAIPEVLIDRETALFVPPGDQPALARCIAELRGDIALQQRLVDQGYELYRRVFTMEAFTAQLETLYTALSHSKRPAHWNSNDRRCS
jgi:glycosyltransferase involved in cell wall biosynthesis